VLSEAPNMYDNSLAQIKDLVKEKENEIKNRPVE
jgi:hypothetical protein